MPLLPHLSSLPLFCFDLLYSTASESSDEESSPRETNVDDIAPPKLKNINENVAEKSTEEEADR